MTTYPGLSPREVSAKPSTAAWRTAVVAAGYRPLPLERTGCNTPWTPPAVGAPAILGQRVQRRGRPGRKRSSVPGREHPWFQVRQHPDQPLHRRPVPGRIPRRAGDPLATKQRPADRVQVDGEGGVPGDHHPITWTQIGDMARGVPGREHPLPARQPRAHPPAGPAAAPRR